MVTPIGISDPGLSVIVKARSHPLRASLSREMHVRNVPRLNGPTRAIQTVFQVDEQQAADSLLILNQLVAPHGATLAPGDRFLNCPMGDVSLLWERHSEFMTYSFLIAGDGSIFDLAPFGFATQWLRQLPGHIIRSTHICLTTQSPPDEAIDAWFARDDLIISDVANGSARIWSDFRLHADEFGRLLILDKGLQGIEAAQLLQRLQELGNYRKMALLGLPQAQQATPVVTALEQRLTAITARVAQPDTDADSVLEELSTLSAELAQIVAGTRYRMSATHAYGELCFDRIRRLHVTPVRGYGSLDDFTERRLLPAMRTCDAFNRRLEDLSQRVAWTSAMLRTRVDTALARRNRDLLASMDRRTGLQLRLQHTVEGLSVVAISYYALGLWHHMAQAIEREGGHLPPWLDIALIPIIMVAVWAGLRKIRKVKRPAASAHP